MDEATLPHPILTNLAVTRGCTRSGGRRRSANGDQGRSLGRRSGPARGGATRGSTRSRPARTGRARGKTIWGTELWEPLKAELPSCSPIGTGSRYLAMRVRELLARSKQEVIFRSPTYVLWLNKNSLKHSCIEVDRFFRIK
jgi:hypothetical protein